MQQEDNTPEVPHPFQLARRISNILQTPIMPEFFSAKTPEEAQDYIESCQDEEEGIAIVVNNLTGDIQVINNLSEEVNEKYDVEAKIEEIKEKLLADLSEEEAEESRGHRMKKEFFDGTKEELIEKFTRMRDAFDLAIKQMEEGNTCGCGRPDIFCDAGSLMEDLGFKPKN